MIKTENAKQVLNQVDCPYCKEKNYTLWASENGFDAVKCNGCGIVYVNPRPSSELIDSAVKTGTHAEEFGAINVVTGRMPSKVKYYQRIFKRVFSDVWQNGTPITWLDVGAGFGEVMEAIRELAPSLSSIEGLEPMHPKAMQARNRGLTIHEHYLDQLTKEYQFISVINVFSHLPDFHEFLRTARERLVPNGEILIETGNVADMERSRFSGVLSLPDHLVFSGERHIHGYLEKAGFEVVGLERFRTDTVVGWAKDIARKLMGQPVLMRLPYTSPYRSLLVRARRK